MEKQTIENRINDSYIRERKELIEREGLTGMHDERITKIRLGILEHLFPEGFKIMRRIYENNKNLWKNNDIDKIHDIVSDISEVYPPIVPYRHVLAYAPFINEADSNRKIAFYNLKSKKLEVRTLFDYRKKPSLKKSTKIRISDNVKDIFKDFSIKEVVETVGVYGAFYEHLTENGKLVLPQFRHIYPFGDFFSNLTYKKPEFQPTSRRYISPDFSVSGPLGLVLEKPDFEKHFWMKPIESKERLRQIIRDPKWFKRAYLLKMFFDESYQIESLNNN